MPRPRTKSRPPKRRPPPMPPRSPGWRDPPISSSSTRPATIVELMRLAHTMADTLITPLNDSFVDFDVLGSVDPETFGVAGASHYAETVQEARGVRRLSGQGPIDWIVLRNRLSVLGSRNKRIVGDSLQALSASARFPVRRGTGRAADLPRVLSAWADGPRRHRRRHPRRPSDHVACHGPPGGGRSHRRHRIGYAGGKRGHREPEPRRGLKPDRTR